MSGHRPAVNRTPVEDELERDEPVWAQGDGAPPEDEELSSSGEAEDDEGRQVLLERRHRDLRHYLASMLIASGADVRVVQARLRRATAKTTLDTRAHLW